MTVRSRCMALTLLVAVMLGLSACERGQSGRTASASGSSTDSSASPPSSTAAEPAHLITPETLDKAPMVLKYGESASIRRGGVTVTVTPGTVEKFDGTPKGGEREFDNCGLWLALPVHVVIDVQSHSEWGGWGTILYPYGLFSKDKHDLGSASNADTEEPDDIRTNTQFAYRDWSAKGRNALHWDFTGKQYLTACKKSYEPNVPAQPDDRPIIGLAWDTMLTQAEETTPRHRPPLAVWFP